LTGRQHLQYYKTRFGLKTDITKMLELVHLPEPSWDRKVKNYSLGMKQRLSIAIALLDNPELIILDEPVNGLDPQGISDLRKMILNLRDQLGVTFLISSHILSELEFITDKYIIMKKGKILNVMSSKELANDLSEKIFLKTSDNQILKMFLEKEGIVHFEQDDYLVVTEKERLMAKTTAHTHNESRKTGNSSEATRDPNKTQPKLIKNRKHDAAILFIHGIGNQKAGAHHGAPGALAAGAGASPAHPGE